MSLSVVSVKGMNHPALRREVCYIGRQFAGWPGHALANRYKGSGAVEMFRAWLDAHPEREQLLAAVWDQCGRGQRPLGCWCLPAPWPVNLLDTPVCHAQVVAVEVWRRVLDGRLPPPASTD